MMQAVRNLGSMDQVPISYAAERASRDLRSVKSVYDSQQ
jgi:hypothetical protein